MFNLNEIKLRTLNVCWKIPNNMSWNIGVSFLKRFLSKFVVNECLTGVNMKRNEHERRGINDNI